MVFIIIVIGLFFCAIISALTQTQKRSNNQRRFTSKRDDTIDRFEYEDEYGECENEYGYEYEDDSEKEEDAYYLEQYGFTKEEVEYEYLQRQEEDE